MSNEFTLQKNTCNYMDIARLIGIYLVILGHAPVYGGIGMFIHAFIYSFHMPFFFAISGILHKQEVFNLQSVKRLSIAMLVPYVIYNLIGLVFILFGKNASEITAILHEVVSGQVLANPPTWFFLSLFGVKFISLFLRSKFSYCAVSLGCIILLYLYNIYIIEYDSVIYYRINSVLLAFPCFSIGYLMKEILNVKINILLKWFIVILSIAFLLFSYQTWGSIDMAWGGYNYILVCIANTIVSVLGIVFLSQLIFKYLNYNSLKILSRGTMPIVGLHVVILDEVIKPLIGKQSFILYVVISFLLLLLFYYFIRFTYTRYPILYGKSAKIK